MSPCHVTDYPRIACPEVELWAEVGGSVDLQCSVFSYPNADIKMTYGIEGTEDPISNLQNADFQLKVSS